MSEFEIVELEPQQAAVLGAAVPMAELPAFFGRAFHEVMEVVGRLGVAVAGPPFGYYPGMPGPVVEVMAGFPTSSPIEPSGQVVPMTLPGGRAVRAVHVGPYDTMVQTYGRLEAWVAEQGLRLADHMWESYLSDPDTEPDPSTWRTLIVWPLAAQP